MIVATTASFFSGTLFSSHQYLQLARWV